MTNEIETRETLSFSDLDSKSENSRDGLRDIWAACDGPIYLVVDQEGENMAEGRVRHLNGDLWIYVDNVDGFRVISAAEYEYLELVKE